MNYKRETFWKYVRSLWDMSNTYCNEPWRTAHYDEVGKLGPCCTYRGKRPDFTKIDDYWNSDWLRDFRKQLGSGVKADGSFSVGVRKIVENIHREQIKIDATVI